MQAPADFKDFPCGIEKCLPWFIEFNSISEKLL